MPKRIIYTLFLCLLTISISAQPKWAKKTRRAQVNLITYDATGKLLHSTNGFIIDAEGTTLSDYHSFRGAARAVAIDEGGREWPVTAIAGANSLCDVVKVKVAIPNIKLAPLATADEAIGAKAYILPYLSNKANKVTETTITNVSKFRETYAYYTLPVQPSEKSESCPVMNERGELLGLLQLAANENDKNCYVLSAAYAKSLATTALSATASDYRDIFIKKVLPGDASQANSFIYLIGTRDSALYLSYVEDFIHAFPTDANGYTMKAEFLCTQGRFSAADSCWDAGLQAQAQEDAIRYSRAQAIFQIAQSKQELPDFWTIERALQEIDAAIAVEQLPVYISLRAKLLYALKRYEDACQQFLQVNETNLRSADYFLYAAQCQLMLRDTTAVLALQDSAVACFTKPYMENAAPALLMRATTLVKVGRYRDAVRDLNDYEHLKSKELTANFYYQREQTELQCRMYQQALNDIETAVRMEPREPLYHAELASVNYRIGQIDEAVAAARQAVAIDDQFADAYRILGVCLRSQGKEQDACAAFQRAIDLGDELSKTLIDKKR